MQVYVQSYGSNYAYIVIIPDAGYTWYRLLIQDRGQTVAYYNHWYTYSEVASGALYVTGLPSGTACRVTVQYNNSGQGGGGSWIGPVEFTTTAAAVTYYVTLNFNANGGSGAPAPKTYQWTSSSIPVTLPSTIPTRNGYTFLGWATSPTATVEQYVAGGYYSNWWGSTDSGYSQTLYAVWKQSSYSVTVVYNANGGTGAPSSHKVSGSSNYLTVTLSSTKPTRRGYVFQGWTDNEGSSIAEWQAGSIIANVYASPSSENYQWILYAVWAEESTGGVHIDTGTGFAHATAYVWDGSWQKITPYIWDGSWKVAT